MHGEAAIKRKLQKCLMLEKCCGEGSHKVVLKLRRRANVT